LRIEVLAPLKIRVPGGKIQQLTLGCHTELPYEQAKKLLAKAPGKVRAVSTGGPRFYLGNLVQVHHQDGRVEAGEVQGLTRIEAPSVCRPGYWYWVLSETGEQWVHESLLELGE